MKHKRVLFGLLAAVAAMMFLFCGDSVVTTGTGNEVPGTTPGTEGGDKQYIENVYILANTSKGISITNPEKLKKSAATASNIAAALEIIRVDSYGKTGIALKFGSDAAPVLDIGSQSAEIKGLWSVGAIELQGSIKGGTSTAPTIVLNPTGWTGDIVWAVQAQNTGGGKVLGSNSSSLLAAITFASGTPDVSQIDTPPTTGGGSTTPRIVDPTVVWTTDDAVRVKFDISVSANVWLYLVPASLGTPSGTREEIAATIKFFGEKINGNTPTKEVDEILTPFSDNDRVGVLVVDSKDTTLFDYDFLNPTGLVLSGSVTGRTTTESTISISTPAYGQFSLYQVIRAYSENAADLTAKAIIEATNSFVDVWSAYGYARTITITTPIANDVEVWFVIVNTANATQISSPLNVPLVKDKIPPALTKTTGTNVRRGTGHYDPIADETVYNTLNTTATIKFNSDENVGTVYWLWVTDGSAQTPTTIKTNGTSFPLSAWSTTTGTGSNLIYWFESDITITTDAGKIYVVAEDIYGNVTSTPLSFDVNAYIGDDPTFDPSFSWVIGGVTSDGSGGFTGSAKINLGTLNSDASLSDVKYVVVDAQATSSYNTPTSYADLAARSDVTTSTSWLTADIPLTETFVSATGRYTLYVGAITQASIWGGGITSFYSVPLAPYNDKAPAFEASGEPVLTTRIGNTASFTLTVDDAGYDVYYQVSSSAIASVEYTDIVPTSGTSAWNKLSGSTELDNSNDPVAFERDIVLAEGAHDVYFAVVNPVNGEVLFDANDSKVEVLATPSIVFGTGANAPTWTYDDPGPALATVITGIEFTLTGSFTTSSATYTILIQDEGEAAPDLEDFVGTPVSITTSGTAQTVTIPSETSGDAKDIWVIITGTEGSATYVGGPVKATLDADDVIQ
jgi:hypothetical protein